MKESLKLQVFEPAVDGINKPVTDATVAFHPQAAVTGSRFPHAELGATHTHLADGFYGTFVGTAEAEPKPGKFLLVVRKDGFSPVVQRLTLRVEGEVLRAEPGWSGFTLAEQAATVTIVNVGRKVKGDAAKHATINVLLFPRLEMVALCGVDPSGTDYTQMAEGRCNILLKRRVLNPGTISTIFHAKNRTTIVAIRSASNDRTRRWLALEAVEKNPLSEDKGKKRPLQTLRRELSIVDFYAHLHDRGTSFAGTVVEAGIFSHSWTMGPVIWNTVDSTSSVTGRSEDDTDGRQKDWLPNGKESFTPTGRVTQGDTMARFSNLAKAFKSQPAAPAAGEPQPHQPALRVWGCSHMQTIFQEIRVALPRVLALPNDPDAVDLRQEFFRVRPLTTYSRDDYLANGEELTTLNHVKRLIAQFVVGDLYSRAISTHDMRAVLNYGGAAARFLEGIPVFAAPPGMGSLYGKLGGEATFFIEDKSGENFPLFRWFRAEFREVFVEDELHYIDYQALRKAPLADPGFRTERFAMFIDVEQFDFEVDPKKRNSTVVLRLPSGLEIHRRVDQLNEASTVFGFRRPVPFNLNGVAGHFYRLPRQELTLVERRGLDTVVFVAQNDTVDAGAFVGQDGRTLWLSAPRGQRPQLELTPLPQRQPTFFRGRLWREPFTPLPPILDGVIETVAPRYFW